MKDLKILLFLLLSINSYSQSDFVQGYFIDNAGIKTNCLIIDSDWDSNPRVIHYKLDQNSKLQVSDISLIKEFGSLSDYIFKRYDVLMDVSKTNEIDNVKSFTFYSKTLFLKEIVSGSANLYSYNDSGSMKYFFNTNPNETPVQLEYKRYSFGTEIFVNNNFRQQLFNTLKSDKLQQSDFDKLEYRSTSLIKIFQKYNGLDDQKQKNIFKKLIDFNLYLKAGYQNNSFSADSNNDFIGKFDFEDVSEAKFGVEAEFVFPSKSNNNFAAFIELSHSSFSGEITKPYGQVKMDYATLEVPIGFKYYLRIGKSSKIFISGAIQFMGVELKSDLKMEQFQDVYGQFNKGTDFNFGVGYKFDNRFLISVNTTTDRSLLTQGFDSDFKSTYLFVGYNFFAN